MIDPRVLKDVITPAATDDPANRTTLDVEKDLGLPVAETPADADRTPAPASTPAEARPAPAPRDR